MLVQRTAILDPNTRLPLTVIDTSKLKGQLPDEHTIRKSIQQLPKSETAIIFFASHSPKKLSITWLQNANKLIGHDIRKRIKRVYIVHENWVYKALLKTLGSMLSPKFIKKLVYIKDLSELARHCDITLLNISRDVYLHDIKHSDQISIPKNPQPLYGYPLEYGLDFFPQILNFLYVAPLTAKSFEKTGGSELVWILRQAFDRNQTIDLTEYGPQMVIAAFKLYLFELPTPLLPIDRIPLPIKESDEYWSELMQCPNGSLLLDIHRFLHHAFSVYHVDAKIISQSFGPALCGLINPSRDNEMICVRVARLLTMYSEASPSECVGADASADGVHLAATPLRDAEYDISAEDANTPAPNEYAPEATPDVDHESSSANSFALNTPPGTTLLAANQVGPLDPSEQLGAVLLRPTSPVIRPSSPLKESTNITANLPTLKPVKPIAVAQRRALKPKPSLRNVRGMKVSEIAKFYENI